MKILHTADIHIGEFPGPERGGINCRLQDTLGCMEFLAETAKAEKPDVILICGDLFHRAKLWGDEMLYEVQAAIDWLIKLADTAPVCLLYGTPNHDNMEAFNTLRKALSPATDVYIFTEPSAQGIVTRTGVIQICGLPGFDRGHFRSRHPGLSKEEENQVFTEELGKIVLGLKAQCRPEYPSILMAHYTVPGANLESGQTQMFSQAEPLLLPETLDAAAFDLVALGHIHRPQKLDIVPNAFYAGAINAFNFNDEGQKRGFWIHELSENTNSRFFETPCRKFRTIKFTDTDIVAANTGEFDAVTENWRGWNKGIKDHIVRVLYSCSEEANKAFNKAALEKRLYDDGAFWVSDITPEQITVTANRDNLSETDSPENNLRNYLIEKMVPDERIESYMEAARPIIAQATANSFTAQLHGLFEPLEIEVRNYRNYPEEHFDFRDITFCTINGINGSGKSSLFMDAILDCLFEEPREGDLTGWIRQDNKARSGAIIFTFRIGEKIFRVTRTRAKSGKATLNLSEFVNNEWLDRSRERFGDTQAEIINILGMDSLTLRSCALIMQDQYGLFLQADKEARIRVLGDLLGLGIYSEMEAITKERAGEINRQLRSGHDEIERLIKNLANEDEIRLSISEYQRMVDDVSSEIQRLTPYADSLKLRLGSKLEATAHAAKLRDSINAMETKKSSLAANKIAHEAIIFQADSILAEATNVANGVAQYNILLNKEKELLTEKATFDAKKRETAIHAAEVERLAGELSRLHHEQNTLHKKIGPITALLDQEATFVSQAAEYKAKRVRLQELEAISEQWRELQNRKALLIQEHATEKAAYENECKHRKAQAEALKTKAQLLENSGCVDSARAQCAFLKDAVEAKSCLEPYLNECRQWKESRINEINDTESRIAKIGNEQEALNYEPNAVTELRRDITRLEEAVRLYESLGAYREQLQLITDRLHAVDSSINDITGKHNEAQRAYQASFEAVSALEQSAQAYDSIRLQISAASVWLDKEKELPVATERKNAAAMRIEEITAEIEALDCEIAKSQITLTHELETAIGGDTLQCELNQAETRINELNKNLKNYYSEIGALNGQLEQMARIRTSLGGLQAAQQKLSIKAAIFEELKKAFSQDGIPHNIIRSTIPMLTATANNILAQMTGGKTGMEFVTERVLKSNSKKEITTLDIFIEEYGVNRLSYMSKSGGEKVKAALSAILALAEIKSGRAGIQLGMLFIDEPPFLDHDGVQAYCDALETIQSRYKGLKIMAITHDPAMKARFPQSLDVIKTAEGSRLLCA